VSIHLVGGGRDETYAQPVYGSFVEEATAHAQTRGVALPRIAVIAVVEDGSTGEEVISRFSGVLALCGPHEVVPYVVNEGETLASGLGGPLDGVLVAGGLTPAYAEALAPVAEQIRDLVVGGVPYLGFSAGAAIAARRAIVGGWRIGELPICAEDNAEDLDQLTVVEGLGLTEVSLDVHAAQWGNLARMIMAVKSHIVDLGVAIDEDTVLILDSRGNDVRGAGQVWTVLARDSAVLVLSRGAEQPV
jgi:cyanophycinase